MPDTAGLETIARQWFDAFNEHNLEALLSLYHKDAVHFSPKLKVRRPETAGLIKGKDALRTWWQEAFERLPSLHYQPVTFTANDNRVFMEYIRHADNQEDMPVAEVLEIRDALIVSSKVYHG